MARKANKHAPPARRAPVEEPGAGFGGLAAALAAQGLASGDSASSAAPTSPPDAAPPPTPAAAGSGGALRGKVVVRQERKGRGGKTVTLLEGPALATLSDLDAFARRVRKALGTGARVEGSAVAVQGDQREAAGAWLGKQGATVVLGN